MENSKDLLEEYKDIPVSNKNAFNYQGNVTIKIVKDHEVIAVKKSHNAGGPALFKFLSYCLAGEYTKAEKLRPVKVKLFYNSSIFPTQIDESASVEASLFVYTNATPVVSSAAIFDSEGNPTTKFSTTLHFLIPYTNIISDYINEVRLYGKKELDVDKYSAIYYFTKETINNEVVWDTIDIPAKEADNYHNYSLIIEWELAVVNANA